MRKLFIWLMVLLFVVLLSLPWLVPHCGALALFAFVPLLCADAFASELKIKHFWLYAFAAFATWNAVTTFWVCNATVGGGIAAIVVNAAVMTIIWSLFRLAKRHLGGALPYVFLAAAWIAWERFYFSTQISWPWLTLGNAFAQTTSLVQWYEYTGTLGGSLWVWASGLGVFGLIVATADEHWSRIRPAAAVAALLGVTAVIAGPMVLSRVMYRNFEEKSEGTIDFVIGQPNFDPYQKFQSLTQAQQNAVLLNLFKKGADAGKQCVFLAPETFTSDIILGERESSPTVTAFRNFLLDYPGSEILFGASTYDLYDTHAAPNILARPYAKGWSVNHNSAILVDGTDKFEIFHKSKLVVGAESTPFPKVFVPLDNWLSSLMGVGGLMGRCVGQPQISLLNFQGDKPLGCAVCYESVYGEYCTGYVKAGAKAMTIITNDAWWGDTPGYRQHCSYARLRAIELRRDFARCGNTGISCFIDQRGDVLQKTEYWEPAVIKGQVNLRSDETFFVRYGDVVGRVCTLMFILLALLLLVKLFTKR